MQILKLAVALPKNGYTTEKLLEAFPCKLPEKVRKNVLNLGVSKRYFIKYDDSNSKSENIMRETDLINLCSEACKDRGCPRFGEGQPLRVGPSWRFSFGLFEQTAESWLLVLADQGD